MGRLRHLAPDSVMIEVANLYYRAVDNFTKLQIAQQMGTSEQWVAKVLKEAREVGIVKIEIAPALHGELSRKLVAAYPHLVDALIVPTKGKPVPTEKANVDPPARSDGQLLKCIGTVASEYFDRAVTRNKKRPFRVGVTGGESILEFANALPDRLRDNVHFHSTALVGRGRVPDSVSHIDPYTLTTLLWSKSGRLPGHLHYTTVTPYETKARSWSARKHIQNKIAELAAMPSVREAIKELDSLDMIVAGIGLVNNSGRLTMTGLLAPLVTAEELQKEGAVADFCYNLIDEKGATRDLWRLFLTPGHYSGIDGLAFLQKLVEKDRRVVAVVGQEKISAVLATLKAKAFNVLITDSETAAHIVALSGRRSEAAVI